MDESRQPEVGRASESVVDHYDFINAPQYVDFAELAQNDDPNADVFFETHREEDDFLIAIDNINPTIQLLNEEQVLHSNENEVNSAVSEAGMDDVKVVYYASPPANNSKGFTAGRKTTSLDSTIGSFHTPLGDISDSNDDKENFAPSPEPEIIFSNAEGKAQPAKKLSYSGLIETTGMQNSQEGKVKSDGGKREYYSKPLVLRDSLLSQLDKLTILSSDEEDAEVETIEESCYQSPTQTPIKTDESFVENILKTPGAIKLKPSKYAMISSQKVDFFEGLSLDDDEDTEIKKSEVGAFEKTLVVAGQAANKDQKIISPNSIKHQTEEFYKNEFPVFKGPSEGENRKQSFLVDATVGQEVVWKCEDVDDMTNNMHSDPVESMQERPAAHTFDDNADIPHEELLHLLDTANNEEMDNADDTLTSSFGTYHDGPTEPIPNECDMTTMENGMNRRASSCSDLSKLQASMKQSTSQSSQTSKISRLRAGLTIPQSPEASKRPATKCRSICKANDNCNIPSSSKGSIMSKSSPKPSVAPKNPKFHFVPSVPYKGAVGGTARVPLKANHYVSLAEAVSKFQKNTPDRFRTLPRGRIPIKRSSSCEVKTESRFRSPSPALETKTATSRQSRSRVSTVSSNSTNVTHGPSGRGTTQYNQAKSGGGFMIQKKATSTIPQPFNLSSAKPKTAIMEIKDDTTTDFKFKARPAPKSQSGGIATGLKPRVQLKVTQPMAPHFASDDRIRERHEKKAQSTNHSPTISRPGTSQSTHTARPSRIPTTGCKIRAPTPELPKTTEMKPFSFDQRNKQMLLRKEEKIKKEIEEELKHREFHANPLPNLAHKLPKKIPIPVTHVEPFHLKADERGVAYQEALKQKLEEEERQRRQMATFHANPPVVLQKPAFEPEHPVRAPLASKDFHLNTELRAAEREQYDQYLKQKEMEEEERRREEQARLEELQHQEELERRRQLIHKAQPFRPPKPFEVKASAKTLTVPQSPAFHPLPSQRRTSPTKTNKSESP